MRAADEVAAGSPNARSLEVRALAVPEEPAPSVFGELTELVGSVPAVGIPMQRGEDGLQPAGISVEAARRLSGRDSAGLMDTEQMERLGFNARPGETLVVPSNDAALPTVVYLGWGEAGDAKLAQVRDSAAALVRSAGKSASAMLLLPSSPRVYADATGTADGAGTGADKSVPVSSRAARAAAEGGVLGAYRFSEHKSQRFDSAVQKLAVVGVGFSSQALEQETSVGARIAEAVSSARDLVNEPASSMTPTRLAEAAMALVAPSEFTEIEVWGPERIEEERLGGVMGVSRGSGEPAMVVRIDYRPPSSGETEERLPHVVLVGKGITFDSGGLSLKTAEGMVTMKTDMSGAAAVICAASACADLGIAARVTAIAPLTENMPGGRAIKPGDVLTARGGQTIEVLNTDAEGRLILADGLSLATEMRPDAIIDLATLTGAAVMALGGSIAAMFSNDDTLAERVLSAGERAGERLWRLPLPEDYQRHIDSEVADMKNIGKPGQAGAIVAALLLERFVGDVPWAHIDMAGPARSDEADGVLSKGGTGFGVRTLIEFLQSLVSDGS